MKIRGLLSYLTLSLLSANTYASQLDELIQGNQSCAMAMVGSVYTQMMADPIYEPWSVLAVGTRERSATRHALHVGHFVLGSKDRPCAMRMSHQYYYSQMGFEFGSDQSCYRGQSGEAAFSLCTPDKVTLPEIEFSQVLTNCQYDEYGNVLKCDSEISDLTLINPHLNASPVLLENCRTKAPTKVEIDLVGYSSCLNELVKP